MGKLAAVTCETVKPNKARDRLVGDGDGLFLRIRPNGTKTWVIEYDFKGERRKYTIGLYVPTGAPGASIGQWLRHGRLSLTQARAIAGEWKAARRGGHDPVIEWEAQLEGERAEEVARANAIAAEENQLYDHNGSSRAFDHLSQIANG
jgi:Arm DNA-binding domain